VTAGWGPYDLVVTAGAALTVAVVGAAGQLGRDLVRAWERGRPADRLVRLTHADLDVGDLESVRRALLPVEPQLVVNATAYNLVDRAEMERDHAFHVNAVGPHNLAWVAREFGAVLVHVSTDYVFSGDLRRPYIESDPVAPVNVYGASKAAGEMLVRSTLPEHFIVRTSGLYGVGGARGKGGNFVEAILRAAQGTEPVRVVDDQVLTPTYTGDLALQVLRLATTRAFGTYHATSQGGCSWFDFAAEIFHQAGYHCSPARQTTAEAGRPARRPAYSVLDNRGLRELGADQMPDWREALGCYLAERGTSVR
jgi:dTDP-4-dehydrorhamnose reductase